MITYEEIVKNTSTYIYILKNGNTFDDQLGHVVKNREILRKLSYQYNFPLMRPYSLLRLVSFHIKGFDGLDVDKVDVESLRYEILSLV